MLCNCLYYDFVCVNIWRNSGIIIFIILSVDVIYKNMIYLVTFNYKPLSWICKFLFFNLTRNQLNVILHYFGRYRFAESKMIIVQVSMIFPLRILHLLENVFCLNIKGDIELTSKLRTILFSSYPTVTWVRH